MALKGDGFRGDPFALYGKLILQERHDTLLKKHPRIKSVIRERAQKHDPYNISSDIHARLHVPKVGILGAGIAGLYSALILDSLDIEYEILEASDRVGGRLRTYHFPGGGKYDYYEEGAMRFPLPKKDKNGKYKNGVHARLADLTLYPPLNEGPDPLNAKLIPYYFAARDPSHPGIYYFNGVHQQVLPDVPKGPFKAEAMGVSAPYIKAGPDAIHQDVLNPFIRIIEEDLTSGGKDGWAVVLQNDTYSVRGYMASKYLPSYSLKLPPRHLPPDVIDWLSLLQSTDHGYDRALTEAVFDALAFAEVHDDSEFGNVEWKCFEGGTETLSKKIYGYLNSKGSFAQLNKQVTAIRIAEKIDANTCPSVSVQVNGSEWKKYGHVISTLPLTVLRTVNLREAGLSISQKNALRSLDYGPAIKIAILFKSNWWTTKLGIIGGQTYTDLPIFTVVYPSYGVDSNTPSRVLIASYTRTADASRLSALGQTKDALKKLVLENLAEAHSQVDPSITYEYLLGEFEALHIKDWNEDRYSMGAFAFFSPGDYGRLYSVLNVPAADGCLHFAGEALSTRHGWVVGALDSAWKSIYEYLKITKQTEKLKKFEKLWGKNWEWSSDSEIADGDHDLLDEHFGLVTAARKVIVPAKAG